MKFNFENLRDRDTEAIINRLIQYVTKTDDEIFEEGREEKKKTNELKVFVAENDGFELGSLEDRIEDLALNDKLSKHERAFFNEHTFEEFPLNDEVSYVEIGTPDYDRSDQFIFLVQDGYLRVLTTERRKWTKKTVEKLIKYLPDLDRVFLSSDNLEEIVTHLRKTDLSGFTAKYQPYYRDQKISIQFHGAEEGDLKKVEDEFNARPTRMEFKQRNSPAAAVKGAIDQHGYFSIPRVRLGSEDVGYDTIMQLGAEYENYDQQNFEVEHSPRKEGLEHGFVIEGYTTLELIEEYSDSTEEEPTHEDLIINLKDLVLDSKRRYEYTEWEEGNYIVYDKERKEPFEITIEDRNIILHAKPATSSDSFRDFYTIIQEEFNTTYRLEKTSGRVRA